MHHPGENVSKNKITILQLFAIFPQVGDVVASVEM